jgi:hypothetical protein
VTVTRASRSKIVTVSESQLLPGPDSLLAPAWVPWTDRVRPGDLKAGDLMPASSDDERLVPYVALAGDTGLLDWDESDAWSAVGELSGLAGLATVSGLADELPGEVDQLDTEADETTAEPPPSIAIGRPEAAIRPRRVLSAIGRDEAAVRWYVGDHGPRSPLANAAPACCITCGFMIRLNGPLGRVFGVCANEFAPDDGRVVSVDHGCGAHSDGDVVADGTEAAPTVDELGYDMLNAGAALPDSMIENLDHELLLSASARRAAVLARDRFRCGTYTRPNNPMPKPAAQVQIHQWLAAENWCRSRTTATSATAQAAVPTDVMIRSLPSSGGGAARSGGACRGLI